MKIQIVISILLPLLSATIANWLLQRIIKIPNNLQSSRTQTYVAMLKSLVTLMVYGIAIYYVFIILNIDVTPLFASAGAVGLIIGLGLRSFIEDFFTGMFILTEDTIRVGDYVDIGGSEGVTESLGLRTVRIRDKNGAVHIFPNREIRKIINYSKRQARVIIDFPVKTNQPVDTVFTALERAITRIKKDKHSGRFIHDNSKVEGVESINPGYIIIRVLLLTRASERWDTARTFRKLALVEMKKSGIELA